MVHGTHNAEHDKRNDEILIFINGAFMKRAEAKISVFDSGYLMGDGIWEGVRLHYGRLVFIEDHLNRLWKAARATSIQLPFNKEALIQHILDTVAKNEMINDVHIRVMITRGIKKTPSQDPRLTLSGPNLVIIAKHKKAATSTLKKGIEAGADEALMLDINGFVSTCNATNFFIVTDGEVWTSTDAYCMNGITRSKVIDLCHKNGVICREKNFSLYDVYSADEAFVTGTFGGLTPVRRVDGKLIGNFNLILTQRLQALYYKMITAS